MTRYYLSRAFISVAFGGLFVLAGSPWWVAALTGAITFALFLWAPHSGRYTVHPELGITALRHDERTQAITDKAARIAFVVTIIMVGGLAVYFRSIALADVPVRALSFALAFGVLTYFVADFWLRRM
jgi:hypothetical protein